jgi:hypothetical protein
VNLSESRTLGPSDARSLSWSPSRLVNTSSQTRMCLSTIRSQVTPRDTVSLGRDLEGYLLTTLFTIRIRNSSIAVRAYSSIVSATPPTAISPFPSQRKSHRADHHFRSLLNIVICYPRPCYDPYLTICKDGQPMWEQNTWLLDMD